MVDLDASMYIAISITSSFLVLFTAFCFVFVICCVCCSVWCVTYSFNLSSIWLCARNKMNNGLDRNYLDIILGDKYYYISFFTFWRTKVERISENLMFQTCVFFSIPLFMSVVCLCPLPLVNFVFIIPIACIIILVIFVTREKEDGYLSRIRKERRQMLLDDQDLLEDSFTGELIDEPETSNEESSIKSTHSGYTRLGSSKKKKKKRKVVKKIIIKKKKKRKNKKSNDEYNMSPFTELQIVNEFLALEKEFGSIDPSEFSISVSNMEKNRYEDILPVNKTLVTVSNFSSKKKNGEKYLYINASCINVNDSNYIAGQWPLNDPYRNINTEDEWWSMIFENDIKIIISLQKPFPPTHAYYFPRKLNEVKNTRNWAILNEGNRETKDGSCYLEIECILCGKKQMKKYQKMKKKENSISPIKSNSSSSRQFKTVIILVYREWPDMGLPNNMPSLKILMERVDEINNSFTSRSCTEGGNVSEGDVIVEKISKTEFSPILVHCSASVGRSGVFILIHSILRKHHGSMNEIESTLRQIRDQRNPEMIQNLEQYKFCYDFLWKYLGK